MIRTLDRHLLVQFMRNAVLVAAATVAVFLILDLLLGFQFLTQKGSLWTKAAYFACRVPGLLNFALPVSALIAVLATVAPMLRRGEFTALGSAGIPLRRATRALLVGCVIIGAVDLAIADLATPPATAQAQTLGDQLEGQGRGGRVWRSQSGATWFAGDALLVGSKDPQMLRVAAATGDALMLAERVVWRRGEWRLAGGGVMLEVRDGAQRLHRLPSGPLPPAMALALPPEDLYRRLLPRFTMSSAELLSHGERSDIATVWSRLSRFLLPPFAAMSLLAVFVRFRNRDRVAVAVVEAVVAALLPVGLILVAGMSADTAPIRPAFAVALGCALAAVQPLWLWLRWRL